MLSLSLKNQIPRIVNFQEPGTWLLLWYTGLFHDCDFPGIYLWLLLTRDIPMSVYSPGIFPKWRGTCRCQSPLHNKAFTRNKPWKVEHYIRVTGEKALKKSIAAKRITDESIDRYLMVWKYCLIGQNILRLWNGGRNGHGVSRGRGKP